jgi:endonuclease/exonuclease/phosphatase family metal-dependent hydrolase
MTFNIQHCLEYKKNKINVPLFAEKIKEYGADVCGLNEVRGKGSLFGYTDQTNALGAALGFERYFAQAIKVNGKGPYGNAIVSRFKLKDCSTTIIPDPEVKIEGGWYETRCVLKAIVSTDIGDVCFLVCHMGLEEDERINAVKTICEIADSVSFPIVLMGDFNTTPEDAVFKPIYERFKDTDEIADNKGAFTYASYKPDVKIDYIFYKGLKCESVKTINEVVSDHFPIIAEFTL